jgi:hypothetical protein
MLHPETAAENLHALSTTTDRAPVSDYQTSLAQRVISLQPRYQHDMQLFYAPSSTAVPGLQHAIPRDPASKPELG